MRVDAFDVFAREKLEAWLAKRGKTPSHYRHMMCFGAHGHSHGHSDGHVGRRSNVGVGRVQQKRECVKDDVPQVSSRDDDVACSLFTVAVSHLTFLL